MLYLSTGGFSDKSFSDVAKCLNSNIVKGLELSAGLYTENLVSELTQVNEKFKIALHNYFPAPKKPFVFNLASSNKDIARMSMEHAKKAIKLSAQFGCPYYSFHAGYLLDPDVNELGQAIKLNKLIKREVGLHNFMKNVNELSDFARVLNVDLLIENNVLSLANSQNFNDNPLLMVDEKETEYIFSHVASNVHLLVDVAHLKVSANSLKFDPKNYLRNFENAIKALHLSDNNGEADTNEGFSEDAWFFEHIKLDLDYYSIEVYEKDIDILQSQYELVSKILETKC